MIAKDRKEYDRNIAGYPIIPNLLNTNLWIPRFHEYPSTVCPHQEYYFEAACVLGLSLIENFFCDGEGYVREG